MPRKRQNFSAEFKFQVALEAAKDQKTVNQLASEFGIHPNRVSEWKHALLDGAQVFASSAIQRGQISRAKEAELYEQIGRLKMEREWLKKKLPETLELKCQLVEPDHLETQCAAAVQADRS